MQIRKVIFAVFCAAVIAAGYTWGVPLAYGSYLLITQGTSQEELQKSLQDQTQLLWQIPERSAKGDRLPIAKPAAAQPVRPGSQYFYNGPRCFSYSSSCPPSVVI